MGYLPYGQVVNVGALLPPPRFVVYDPATGDPLVGGLVHTYVPGGTVPADTWQDADETIPNANPIVLDSFGLLPDLRNRRLSTDGHRLARERDPRIFRSLLLAGIYQRSHAAGRCRSNGAGSFGLLAANGGTIGNPLFVNGNETIAGNVTVTGTATIATPLRVPSGGTGDGTLTANAILIGAGTAAVAFLSPGTLGNVPVSNGTAWVAQNFTTFEVQVQVALFTASTTWTCPTGVTKVRATVIGGGAGGSIVTVCWFTTNLLGGNGGLAIGEYTVVPGNSYTITVGAGGAGVASGASNAGATSSFDAFASATGGGASNGSANGTNGAGSSGTLRNAGAGYGSGVLAGTQVSGAGASAAHTWTIGDPGGAGIGGAGNKGGTSGAILLEWVG